MPTAMHWYNMAAQKWGKVDPKDEKAVKDFFMDTLGTLSDKKRGAIMAYLLGHDGPSKIPEDCDCSACVKKRALYSQKK